MKATKGVVAQAESMRRSRAAKEVRDRRGRTGTGVTAGRHAVGDQGPRAGVEGKLFGSVTTSDIADALKAQFGVEIDRRRIGARRAGEGDQRGRGGGQAAHRRRSPRHRGGRRRLTAFCARLR